MAPTKKRSGASKNDGATVGHEAGLWRMADTLHGSMDAAECKHVVLGSIILKYISDAFEEQHRALHAACAQGADPEDPNKCQVHIEEALKHAHMQTLGRRHRRARRRRRAV